MSKASKLLVAIAASAALGLPALHARATPVSVSDFSFVPGSGYGVDANENPRRYSKNYIYGFRR